MKFWLVVPAAGIGSRMRADCPKQYLQVAGKALLEHTLELFLGYPGLQGIVVPLAAEDRWWPELAVAGHAQVQTVQGGAQRADSVLQGLQQLRRQGAQDDHWVLVHDAARPLLPPDDLAQLLQQLAKDPVGGLLAVPVRDTLKQADAQGRVASTLPREAVWHALTPQMFRLGLLQEALTAAAAAGVQVTDEASAVEWLGHAPRLVEGSSINFKVTRPEDLQLFAVLVAANPRPA